MVLDVSSATYNDLGRILHAKGCCFQEKMDAKVYRVLHQSGDRHPFWLCDCKSYRRATSPDYVPV